MVDSPIMLSFKCDNIYTITLFLPFLCLYIISFEVQHNARDLPSTLKNKVLCFSPNHPPLSHRPTPQQSTPLAPSPRHHVIYYTVTQPRCSCRHQLNTKQPSHSVHWSLTLMHRHWAGRGWGTEWPCDRGGGSWRVGLNCFAMVPRHNFPNFSKSRNILSLSVWDTNYAVNPNFWWIFLP